MLHINCGPQLEVVRDEPDGEPRWCFTCRTKRQFRFVVLSPVGLSYYGPEPSVRCAECNTSDGDCFPGTMREWE